MPCRVLRLTLPLGKFHGRGQFRPGRYARFILTLELNTSADLAGRSDGQRVAFFPDASLDRAVHAHSITKKKNVAAQLAVNGQIAAEHGDGSTDFSRGIDSYRIAKPGDVSSDTPRDNSVVSRGANIAVHVPANPHGLATANHISGDVPIDIDVLASCIDVPVHRALDANSLTRKIDIALDGFILA